MGGQAQVDGDGPVAVGRDGDFLAAFGVVDKIRQSILRGGIFFGLEGGIIDRSSWGGRGVANFKPVGHGLVLIRVGDFDFDRYRAGRVDRQTKISCIVRLLFRRVYRIDRKLGRVVGNGGLRLGDQPKTHHKNQHH